MPEQESSPPRIALIGLGNAGQALLRALAMHGPVRVYDRDPARSSGLAGIAGDATIAAASAADAAGGAELVFLSLPTPEASRSVAAEIAPVLKPGTIVIETSTVAPEDVFAVQQLVEPSGARVIDAAIVGGVGNLGEGRGVFLVGSSEAGAGLAGAVLRRVAEEIFFLAGQGDGMRAKIAINAVAHAVYVVLVEAGALATAQGIPVDVFERLMLRESGLMRPLTHRFAGRLRQGDFAGGMPVRNALKDSALAMAAAQELRCVAPGDRGGAWRLRAGARRRSGRARLFRDRAFMGEGFGDFVCPRSQGIVSSGVRIDIIRISYIGQDSSNSVQKVQR